MHPEVRCATVSPRRRGRQGYVEELPSSWEVGRAGRGEPPGRVSKECGRRGAALNVQGDAWDKDQTAMRGSASVSAVLCRRGRGGGGGWAGNVQTGGRRERTADNIILTEEND